jgi:drug/metabolite transporter (DMT)-like permease
VFIVGSFYFANLGGMNVGVISSVLTTAIFFTSLAYYLAYGEKLNGVDWLGTCLIIGGVSAIGIFQEKQPTQSEDNMESYNIWLAIIFGLLAALFISLNSFMQKYFIT